MLVGFFAAVLRVMSVVVIQTGFEAPNRIKFLLTPANAIVINVCVLQAVQKTVLWGFTYMGVAALRARRGSPSDSVEITVIGECKAWLVQAGVLTVLSDAFFNVIIVFGGAVPISVISQCTPLLLLALDRSDHRVIAVVAVQVSSLLVFLVMLDDISATPVMVSACVFRTIIKLGRDTALASIMAGPNNLNLTKQQQWSYSGQVAVYVARVSAIAWVLIGLLGVAIDNRPGQALIDDFPTLLLAGAITGVSYAIVVWSYIMELMTKDRNLTLYLFFGLSVIALWLLNDFALSTTTPVRTNREWIVLGLLSGIAVATNVIYGAFAVAGAEDTNVVSHTKENAREPGRASPSMLRRPLTLTSL